MPIGNVDASIPLQTVVPNPQNQISGFLDLGRKKLELQRAQDTYAADVAQRKAESSLAQTSADVASRTADPRVAAQVAATDTAQTGAKSAAFKLTTDQQDLGRRLAGGVLNHKAFIDGDQEGQLKELNAVKQQLIDAGIPISLATKSVSRYEQAAMTDPTSTRAMIQTALLQAQSPANQAALAQPSGVGVSNGAQSGVVSTNQFSNVPPGQIIPGTGVDIQPPPTTPTVSTNNGVITPGIIGAVGNRAPGIQTSAPASAPVSGHFNLADPTLPDQILSLPPEQQKMALRAALSQASGAPQPAPSSVNASAPPQARNGFVATGAPIGAEQNINDTIKANQAHYAGVEAAAKTASNDIATLENVKKYAKGAFLGSGSGRQSATAGLATSLGVDVAQAQKTYTDLLNKNAAMLAQQGQTDAARVLSEAANPNAHMTEQAIDMASDQLIAGKKMDLAKQQYLNQFRANSDPQAYAKAAADVNLIADPRIVQFQNYTDAQLADAKKSMSAEAWKTLAAKARKAQDIGLIK